MKKLVLMLAFLICTAHAVIAGETAPLAHVNYQGKLTTATGAPVTDGAHTIVFKFFGVQTGGTSLWESTKSVQTTGGLFSTVISSLPGDMFRGTLGYGSDLWLEIVADGSTLSPRTKVVGVPYSTVAGFALDVANNTITTAQIRDGAVTASKLAPGVVTIPQGHGSGLHADLLDGLHANGFLRANGDNTAFDSLSIGGLLIPSIGQTKGLTFQSGYGGDTGDGAWLRYYPSTRGATAMNLELGVGDDLNDMLILTSNGGVMTPNSMYVGGDLTVTGTISGSVSVPDGSITSAKIADGAISLADIGGNGAMAGQIIKRGSSGWVLANDSDTTYSAGAGLTLSGTMFYIPSGGISSSMIANNPSLSGALSVSGGITASTSDTYGGFIRVSDAGGFYDNNNGWLTAQVGSGLRVRDISNSAWAPLQAGTTNIYGDLTVTGALNAAISPGVFDGRYILKTGNDQIFSGDLINTAGANYRNPLADTMGCISSQLFSSRYYYGPNATDSIAIGEANPVIIPGTLSAGVITAPVLYDTVSGYQVDPGSTSVMSRIDANALYDRANPSYYVDPDDITVLNSLRADRFYSRQDPGNYYLDPDGTSYINEIQSYVFRDRNDPNNYYLNPAATSRLRNIRVGGYGGVADDVQAGIMWNDTTDYGIYRESGAWTSPYPDLRIAFETGIKIGANSAYGGTRFFSGSDMATEIFSVGNGDASVRVNSALYSPITYDKDNVGYFVDPAGTSVVNGLTINGALNVPNASIVSGKLSASGSTAGQVLTSNGSGVVWGSPSAGDGSAYDSRFVNASGDTMSGSLTTSGSVTAAGLYDAANTSYYVDPAGISNVNGLTVNGGFYTPTGKPSLPIAYGYISSSGTKASGTDNVTSTWEVAKTRYVITIAGETYVPASYVTTVTVSGSTPCVAMTSSTTGGDLVVQISNLSGVKIQADFQFVVYKP